MNHSLRDTPRNICVALAHCRSDSEPWPVPLTQGSKGAETLTVNANLVGTPCGVGLAMPTPTLDLASLSVGDRIGKDADIVVSWDCNGDVNGMWRDAEWVV